jgi:ABC-type antimicrobial peptide transport system permease subunit
MKEGTFRTTLVALIIAGVLVLVITSFQNGIVDPDTWWHLATGKYIINSSSIPHQDLFSWTAADQPWVTHEWLAEVLFYLGYVAGRFWGVLSLILLLTALLLVFYWKLLSLENRSSPVAALSVLAVGEMLYPFIEIRPQVLSYLLFVVFLYVLYLFSRRKDYLLVLPFLSALWANSHGSFPLGPVLVALYVSCGWPKITGERIANHPLDAGQRKKLVLVFILCLAAIAFNPNGLKLLLYPLGTVGESLMVDNIQEWLSPNFHNLYNQLFLIYHLGTFVILVLTARKLQLFDLLLFLSFGTAAFIHARFIAYALLVNGLLWARYLQLLPGSKPRLARVKVALIPLLLILYGVVLALKAPPQTAIDYRFTPKEKFPVEALAYLKEHPLKGRMLNDYGWGGYLIWNRPEDKVFIDGRADVYLKKVFRDYRQITRLKPEAAALLESYRIDYVFMPVDAPLVQALKLSPRWSVFYEDETAAILVKKEPP